MNPIFRGVPGAWERGYSAISANEYPYGAARRLDRAARSQTVRGLGTRQQCSMASKLLMKGNEVLWLEGLHPACEELKSVLSVDSPVLQVCWVWFQASRREGERSGVEEGKKGERMRCMCIRENTCLTIFMPPGTVHCIPLPFLVNTSSCMLV